jgi:DNA replication protein DnaD
MIPLFSGWPAFTYRRKKRIKEELYRRLYFKKVLERWYKAGIYSLDEAAIRFMEFISFVKQELLR